MYPKFISNVSEGVQHPDGGLNSSDDETGLAGREKNSFEATNSSIPLSSATSSSLAAASGGEEPSTQMNPGEPTFFTESNFINKKTIVHDANNLFQAGEYPIDTKSSAEDEKTKESTTATSEPPKTPLTSSGTVGLSVPGESFLNATEGSAEENYSATQQSYGILTEESSVATQESSLAVTKEMLNISNEKSLATLEAEGDNSPPVAEETDGSGLTGTGEHTLAAAEDSVFAEIENPQYIADVELDYGENSEASGYRKPPNAYEKKSSRDKITPAEEVSSPVISTKEYFSVATDESFIPTERSFSVSTTDSPREEYFALPSRQSVIEDALTFIPDQYSMDAIEELPLGDSPAASNFESNIEQSSVANKEITIEYDYIGTESFDSASVISEYTTGQNPVKNNREFAANGKSSGTALEQSSVDDYHIGENLNVATRVSTKAAGKPKLPSTTNSMAKMIAIKEVKDGNRDSHTNASDPQVQATRLSQGNTKYEEAEEGDTLQNRLQLVPSFFDFVDNLISLDWVRSKEKVEEPRHASCWNENNCTKQKRQTQDENTRLHQERKTTTSLEASFSTPNAWDGWPFLAATPHLTQTQTKSLSQMSENILILGDDGTVPLLQTQVKRENELPPPEAAPLPSNWNRLKRHLTRSMENHEVSAPEIEYPNILADGNSNALYATAVPTVAKPSARHKDNTSETYLSSHGGTSPPSLNYHFQSRDVARKPWTTSEETKSLRRREVTVEASSLATGVAGDVATVTVVQHLTTNIDCSNCVFQYQIFPTQPALPSPQMTPCTMTQKILTIVMSSSLTSINCINCVFQHQIYTTQPDVPGMECTSRVCVSGSTVTGQMSTTMVFPSPSSLSTWTSALVSTPFHPQYDGRTFGVGPRGDPETSTTRKPERQTPTSESEHTQESSSSWTPTLPYPSDTECSHVPRDYYEDAVQRESLVERLEAVLIYLKEIQTVEPLELQDQMRPKPVKPEDSEKNILGRLNKVVENSIHMVRQIINNLFYDLKTNKQNLILESERFRTDVRSHLGMLKSLPGEFQVKMYELRNLTVYGEERVLSALQCLGEEREHKALREGQYNEDGDEKTTGGVDTKRPPIPSARRKETEGSKIFGDMIVTSPGGFTSRYKGITVSETGLKRTDQSISHPLGVSGSSTDYGTTTTTPPRTPALTVTAIPETTAVTSSNTTLDTSTRTTPTQTTSHTTTGPPTPRSPATPDLGHITPCATGGYWPSVTRASVTPSLRPRVRTDGHSEAKPDYGREGLTRDGEADSPRKPVNTIPPSTREKIYPGMHPATSSHGLRVLGRVAGHRLEDLIHRSSSHLPTRAGAAVFICESSTGLAVGYK